MRIVFDIASRFAGQPPLSLDTTDLHPQGAAFTAEIVRPASMVAAGVPARLSAASFGTTISADGHVIYDKSWPAPGVVYRSTDQQVILSDLVKWTPDTEISIVAWVEEGGERFTATWGVTVPRPAQPYPSWTWDDATASWQAPVAYPQDGGDYVWDEASGAWVAA